MRERRGARRAEIAVLQSKANRMQSASVYTPACTCKSKRAWQTDTWEKKEGREKAITGRYIAIPSSIRVLFGTVFSAHCIQLLHNNDACTHAHAHTHTYIPSVPFGGSSQSHSNAACQCVCVCASVSTMCVYRGFYRVASLCAIIASFGAVLGLIAPLVCHLHTHTPFNTCLVHPPRPRAQPARRDALVAPARDGCNSLS